MEKPREVKVFCLSSNDVTPKIIPARFIHREEESRAIIENLRSIDGHLIEV